MERRRFFKTLSTLIGGSTLARYLNFNPLNASEENNTIHPYDSNRVVRVYDPNVTRYKFGGNMVFWKTYDREILRSMLNKTIVTLSGESGVNKAWNKILSGSSDSDLKGRKVTVKVNFNNTIRDINLALNNSPEMIIVLSRSLIGAGVREKDITVFDCSRPFPEEFKTYIRSENLKDIVLSGNKDSISQGGKFVFLSDNKGVIRNGKSIELYAIPDCITNSDYLINVHLFKIHALGITGAMKNWFGMAPDVSTFMHAPGIPSIQKSNHLPDISLNEEIMKRSKLNISEAIFGGHTPDTLDQFTNQEFFPGGLPSSLIASTSPFYQDIVLYNLMKAEYLTCVPVLKRFLTMGPDTWLQNSARSYPPWKFGDSEILSQYVPGMPPKDLTFKQIDYVSVHN